MRSKLQIMIFNMIMYHAFMFEIIMQLGSCYIMSTCECHQPTSCVAVAVIKCIETDQPWFYIACRKCNKKVNTKNPDDQIEVVGSVKSSRSIHDCPDCGPDVNVIPRFLEIVCLFEYMSFYLNLKKF